MIISTTKTYFIYEKIKQQLQKTHNMFMTLKKSVNSVSKTCIYK